MSLLQAGLSLVSGIMDNVWSGTQRRKEQKRQQAHNKEIAEINWKRNVDMWNMQNAYNTPASQMSRFKEAGLNPHLIYGQGTPGNANQLPKYQQDATDMQSNYQPPQISGVIGQYLNMKSTKAQIDNIKQITKNKEIEGKNLILDGLIKQSQGNREKSLAKIEAINADYQSDYKRLQNSIMEKEVLSKVSQINLNSKQSQKIVQETKLTKQDVEMLEKLGISKSSPILMKNTMYLSKVMDVSPKTLLMAVGGAMGLKMILEGAGSLMGGIGKMKSAGKVRNKDVDKAFEEGMDYMLDHMKGG